MCGTVIGFLDIKQPAIQLNFQNGKRDALTCSSSSSGTCEGKRQTGGQLIIKCGILLNYKYVNSGKV